ncbi:MAG: hypothetical protein PHY59_03250 [Methanobacterium sp.]|nr:hypothetical protein [Methanobacterium sp.]
MLEDLDKETGKKSEKIKDNIEEKDNNKSSKSKESYISEIISIIKKSININDLDSINNIKTEDKKSENSTNSFTVSSNNSNNPDIRSENIKNDNYYYHIIDILNGFDTFNLLKNKKEKITKSASLFIGGFLIIYGFFHISTSATKVADNVMFGEGASLSVFLILVGILIIVAAYDKSILKKTFLNKIHNELEVAEGKLESTDNDTKKVKDKNGNKIDKDNIK